MEFPNQSLNSAGRSSGIWGSNIEFPNSSIDFKLQVEPTGEAPCGAHVFEGFFGLENGPVKSDKSQKKTLLGKDFPKPAKTQS